MLSNAYTTLVKQTAHACGFDYCGIAAAGKLDDDARRLEKWLKEGKQGKMQYMERYFELRTNPALLVPGAKSVITLLKNYTPSQKQTPQAPHISSYAYGKDYHKVIKKQLKEFLRLLKEKIGNIEGRGFVDSAPVLERSWAQKSGLGWIGKNGNLITKHSGSFFFIATLITDIVLEYDAPFAKDYCGSCTMCIDACPTQAILPNKEIDASHCISYFTIELKDELLPANMKNKFQNWMFGCDICQDVCPWNRFRKPHHEMDFKPIPEILNFTTQQWQQLTEESFEKIFKDSALKRAGYKALQRNLHFITS
jgi:epoxyqueuosine reductase